MSISADKIADLRVKHLEMLQSGIARMATYSASAKSYCVTLLTAIVGFAISTKNLQVLYGGFIPIVVFFLLDAQYLRLERRFRLVFDDIRSGNWDNITDFGFPIHKTRKQYLFAVAFSWSVLPFYAMMIIGLCAVIGYMRYYHVGIS